MKNGPDTIYGELFNDVQLQAIFPDSKTFTDCTPKSDAKNILVSYDAAKKNPDFDLLAFVMEHFEMPATPTGNFTADNTRPVEEHIELLWDVLKREKDKDIPGSSLLPLPYPYIVPGGRFNEIYYWDSFFTMQGLKVSGRVDMIESMVKNFAWLIDTVGFIPNGNRTYFLGRSQPPFFAQMVDLLAELKGKDIYKEYLPALEKEYAFWMDRKKEGPAAQRRTFLTDSGALVNRYWDDQPVPRQESYKEDVEDAQKYKGDKEDFYRNIRAACESGWDFSARWLSDPMKLHTIQTTKLIPVDLNCLLYGLEVTLQHAYNHLGMKEKGTGMYNKSKERAAAIFAYCWNEKEGFYFDYHIEKKETTPIKSLAGIFPLYFKLATAKQAERCATYLKEHFLKAGGLVTTPIHSGQQWDAPNGWAPLQYMAYKGLKNY
ncbi:MAG: trehalase, partial [Saprospiraceae bacterium]|nr:trehalase [Saprospiraceae bacterium]